MHTVAPPALVEEVEHRVRPLRGGGGGLVVPAQRVQIVCRHLRGIDRAAQGVGGADPQADGVQLLPQLVGYVQAVLPDELAVPLHGGLDRLIQGAAAPALDKGGVVRAGH